jgi:hypothetical protein
MAGYLLISSSWVAILAIQQIDKTASIYLEGGHHFHDRVDCDFPCHCDMHSVISFKQCKRIIW